MTIAEMQLVKEGRYLWAEYVRINGYSFEPNNAGISKLAKITDLKACFVRKCIHAYLAA